MGSYANKAREAEKQIAYYAEYGNFGNAHSQAEYWWSELSKLHTLATNSPDDAGDAEEIRSIKERAAAKMAEAKKRDAAQQARQQNRPQ